MEYPFKTEPYQHQLDCWRKSRDREAFAFFMEMGCGKTWVSINEQAYLWDAGKIDFSLIIAPKGVYRNWVGEYATHLPDHVRRALAYWDAGESTKKIEQMIKQTSDLRILLVNVEAFSTQRAVGFVREVLSAAGRPYIAVDESTSIKHHDAKRTKAIVGLARFGRYRRILSGEPAANGPLNLYSQFDFLGEDLLGYSSFFTFRNHFAVMERKRQFGGRQYSVVTGYRNTDELTKIIAPHSFIVKKKDCLDLPQKIYETRDVEMTKNQKRVYEQMKIESIAILETDETERQLFQTPPPPKQPITFADFQIGVDHLPTTNQSDLATASAQLVITQLMRLHQISLGFVKGDDGEERDLCDGKNPLIEELLEILENHEGKVIIWANYRHSIKQIVAAISSKFGVDTCVDFYGETTPEQREAAKRDFQDAGSSVRFFVGNQSTAGFGLTLTAADLVVYFSNDYDLEKRVQSEDRAHRIGQRNNVLYLDFNVVGTVSTKINSALKSKKSLSDTITVSNWREILA